jgi:hypothetical protein
MKEWEGVLLLDDGLLDFAESARLEIAAEAILLERTDLKKRH